MNNYRKMLRKSIPWYIFLIIPVFGTLVFNIVPLIQTFNGSFRNTKGNFIGLVNYSIIFSDPTYVQAIINTLYMTVLEVLFNIPLAFIVACLLNSIPAGKNFFKVIFIFPMVMSMVTVAIMFKYLMMPDETGIINYLLSFLSIEPLGFLNDPAMSRESVVLMTIWKGMGYNIIIFFAGLQSVPVEYYESAEIDGANELRKWWNITIPCMRNIFIFILITTTISTMKRFTDVYAISGETGNPAGTLNTMMMFIYKNSFSTYNYKDVGLASTASVILFLFILALTIMNSVLTGDNKLRRKK